MPWLEEVGSFELPKVCVLLSDALRVPEAAVACRTKVPSTPVIALACVLRVHCSVSSWYYSPYFRSITDASMSHVLYSLYHCSAQGGALNR